MYVSEEKNVKGNLGGDIRAKLVSTETNQIVFDHTWDRQPYGINTYIYCPEYKSFPRVEEQPRKIILDALSITNIPIANKSTHKQPKFSDLAVYPTIISTAEGGETRHEEMERLQKEIPGHNQKMRFHEIFNTDCPADTGWDGHENDASQNIGWPFMVKGKAYYPGRQSNYNAICIGDYAYLYYGSASKGKYFLHMQKRSLTNFEKIWKHIIVLPESLKTKQNNVFKVESIIDSEKTSKLKLVNRKTGLIININADFGKEASVH